MASEAILLIISATGSCGLAQEPIYFRVRSTVRDDWQRMRSGACWGGREARGRRRGRLAALPTRPQERVAALREGGVSRGVDVPHELTNIISLRHRSYARTLTSSQKFLARIHRL